MQKNPIKWRSSFCGGPVPLNLAMMVIHSYVFQFITLSVGNKMLGR